MGLYYHCNKYIGSKEESQEIVIYFFVSIKLGEGILIWIEENTK
jgi:hypothetical protein